MDPFRRCDANPLRGGGGGGDDRSAGCRECGKRSISDAAGYPAAPASLAVWAAVVVVVVVVVVGSSKFQGSESTTVDADCDSKCGGAMLPESEMVELFSAGIAVTGRRNAS
jgi:hypothetical protein